MKLVERARLAPAPPRGWQEVKNLYQMSEHLFGSATFGDVLALLSLHLDRGFTMEEIQLDLGTSYESTHRAVRRLTQAGLVSKEAGPGLAHTVVLPRSSSAMALRAVQLKFCSIGPRLMWLRSQAGPLSVDEAFVYGSIAAGTERQDSDIDVLVIGEATDWDVAAHTYDLTDRLRRDVNIMVVHPAEAVQSDFVCRISAGVTMNLISATEAPRHAVA